MSRMDHFSALAEPHRRRMVELLAQGPRAAGTIAAEFQLSAPAVSQHLKVLRDSDLVRVEVDGQRRIYRLDPSGLDEMNEWLTQVRAFWSRRLDRLEGAIAAEKAAKGKGENQ